MYTDDYHRSWTGPYPFTAAQINLHAPNRMGVYQVLYMATEIPTVAYIGIATGATIRGRLAKHVNSRGNWGLGRLGDPTKFAFVYWECDATSAHQIEAHVIMTRKPPFNVRPEYHEDWANITVH